ncbi:MAG TPA: SMI1/KNR4 family protein [Verrucomicrobiae bacterium]
MTDMINTSAACWVAAVRSFILRGSEIPGFTGRVDVALPQGQETYAKLAGRLPFSLPEAVSAFLLAGSARCKFRYEWKPKGKVAEQLQAALAGEEKVFGGSDLCHAAAFSRWHKDCRAWANETWIAEYPDDQATWLNSLPIAAIANGDYLGVDLRGAKSDPPVVYLSHDEESRVIAPSFTGFLQSWAGLCYIGPEIWLLENFLDERTGWLDSTSERAKKLRELFGVI